MYPGPLEDQFDQFQDLLAIYPLSHGKGWQGNKENFVGNLKVSSTIRADSNHDVHVVTRQKVVAKGDSNLCILTKLTICCIYIRIQYV